MPNRPKLDRPVLLHLSLPETVRARLDLFLYSPMETRVPKGAYQGFFLERLREFFDWRRLSLEEKGFPPGSFVAGDKATIDEIERRLA